MRSCWDGFLTSRTSLKDYLGFVCLNGALFDVFQLKFWYCVEMCDCVMSEVERQRERSEERR